MKRISPFLIMMGAIVLALACQRPAQQAAEPKKEIKAGLPALGEPVDMPVTLAKGVPEGDERGPMKGGVHPSEGDNTSEGIHSDNQSVDNASNPGAP